MSVKPDRILGFDADLTPKDVETIRELVADAQANVLLRDTSEDRERLIAALDHMTLTGQDDPFLELIWTNRSDEGDGGASSLALPQEVADAIIAALRGEG